MKYILIILTLACSFNTQAELNIKDNLRNAERSPLFQQKFPSAQISSKGLDIIKLHNGAEMQFHKYTQLTRLDENEKFKPLMKPSTVNQYLQSKPSYSENILQLEDRMIVERNMKVSMKKGVCKQRNLPVSVNELCFVNNNKQIPQETQAYIQSIRKKLKNANDNEQVKNGVTAKQMRNMNDEQLLDVLLNSDDREITMVSVLPTEVYNSPTKSNLWKIPRTRFRYRNISYANRW